MATSTRPEFLMGTLAVPVIQQELHCVRLHARSGQQINKVVGRGRLGRRSFRQRCRLGFRRRSLASSEHSGARLTNSTTKQKSKDTSETQRTHRFLHTLCLLGRPVAIRVGGLLPPMPAGLALVLLLG